MVLARVLSYIMTGTNVLLHLVVHMSPNWTMYNPQTSPHLVGLWVICSKEWGCHRPIMDEVDMNIVRSFMALALAFSFLALTWSVEWDHIIHCNFVFVPKALATAIFNLISGICVLVAVLVFFFFVIEESEEVPPIKKWAFYLSIVICILSFLTGTLDLLSYKYTLWGTGKSNTNVVPEETTEEQIEKQNAQIPRLL